MLCVSLQSPMSKLLCTKLEDLYRMSYSRQRLANSHRSCLQIWNLCIHLWGVTVVYWASINHRAPRPCYENMTILLGTCSTLYFCHLPEWQRAINVSVCWSLSSDSMELNDLGQDDIFDVESLSHSSCKRSRALNLSDRSQIFLKTKKNPKNKPNQTKNIDFILLFLLQYAKVLPGNCPTQIFMHVRPWSFIAFAQRITSFNEFYHAHGTRVFNE